MLWIFLFYSAPPTIIGAWTTWLLQTMRPFPPASPSAVAPPAPTPEGCAPSSLLTLDAPAVGGAAVLRRDKWKRGEQVEHLESLEPGGQPLHDCEEDQGPQRGQMCSGQCLCMLSCADAEKWQLHRSQPTTTGKGLPASWKLPPTLTPWIFVLVQEVVELPVLKHRPEEQLLCYFIPFHYLQILKSTAVRLQYPLVPCGSPAIWNMTRCRTPGGNLDLIALYT